MEALYTPALIIILLAIISTVISSWLRVSTTLVEIMIGIVAHMAFQYCLPVGILDINATWIQLLAGIGALMLTFLAGTELDPVVIKERWKEAGLIGFASFLVPFLGCAAIAYYGLGWSVKASWLTGIVLSTTSVAVVYAVVLEFGLNKTAYGKSILAACFITDLETVLALGLMFSPFTIKTLIFFAIAILACFIIPRLCKVSFQKFGNKPSEFELKFILSFLLTLGLLALWSGSEAVLPAYMIGMVLASSLGKNHNLIQRLRTITFGFLTPFYFIRAGYLVSVPAIIAAPLSIVLLLFMKMATKGIGVYPITQMFGSSKKEGIYTTLLMSTGLTFGSIAALFGLSHNIIDESTYSLLIAIVIASAIVPTIIANTFYLPRHLLSNQSSRVTAILEPTKTQ